MKSIFKNGRKPLAAAIVSSLVTVGVTSVLTVSAASNPEVLPEPVIPAKTCSACNPCNPCGGAKIAADQFIRPAGLEIAYDANFVAEGKRLWEDTSLSSNGFACKTCHQNFGALNSTFTQAYPHKVAMASKRAGVGAISADEMVQFCMLVQMQQDPLPWSSGTLKALTAYTVVLQKQFAANPCAAANPCNPCASACNPCNSCAASS